MGGGLTKYGKTEIGENKSKKGKKAKERAWSFGKNMDFWKKTKGRGQDDQ